jgi:chorismate dehydratase
LFNACEPIPLPNMIRISAVSYLNTAPFIYGITESELISPSEFELKRDIPSVCASRLISGDADIGIVPVAVLPLLQAYKILGNTCIGALKHIDSVMLFSQVPLQEITEIQLDEQSRTSNQLCRILAGDFWEIDPEWLPGKGENFSKIKGTTAAVLIGDRALEHAKSFAFKYDLAAEWYRFTGLPFVFACWVASPNVPEQFRNRFENALQYGLAHLDKVVEREKPRYPSWFEVERYLKETVSYKLDDQKILAMETFLTMSGKLMQYSPV